MQKITIILLTQFLAFGAQASCWTCESIGLYFNSPKPDMIAVTGKSAPERCEAESNAQSACAQRGLIQCQINACIQTATCSK